MNDKHSKLPEFKMGFYFNTDNSMIFNAKFVGPTKYSTFKCDDIYADFLNGGGMMLNHNAQRYHLKDDIFLGDRPSDVYVFIRKHGNKIDNLEDFKRRFPEDSDG